MWFFCHFPAHCTAFMLDLCTMYKQNSIWTLKFETSFEAVKYFFPSIKGETLVKKMLVVFLGIKLTIQCIIYHYWKNLYMSHIFSPVYTM